MQHAFHWRDRSNQIILPPEPYTNCVVPIDKESTLISPCTSFDLNFFRCGKLQGLSLRHCSPCLCLRTVGVNPAQTEPIWVSAQQTQCQDVLRRSSHCAEKCCLRCLQMSPIGSISICSSGYTITISKIRWRRLPGAASLPRAGGGNHIFECWST